MTSLPFCYDCKRRQISRKSNDSGIGDFIISRNDVMMLVVVSDGYFVCDEMRRCSAFRLLSRTVSVADDDGDGEAEQTFSGMRDSTSYWLAALTGPLSSSLLGAAQTPLVQIIVQICAFCVERKCDRQPAGTSVVFTNRSPSVPYEMLFHDLQQYKSSVHRL